MRNEECIIRVLGANGRLYQTFQREGRRWVQTSSRGVVRECTAEQVLSHVLPALAGITPARISVELRSLRR